MAYVPDEACLLAARAAAGDELTQQEIIDAFRRVDEYRSSLEQAGDPVGRDARLSRFAAQEAERAQIAAAMARRHAALNIIVRDKLEESIGYMLQAGMTPRQALLAVLEGSVTKGVRNARTSVATWRSAYSKKYLGGMLGEINDHNPNLFRSLSDPKLDRDIMVEMWELRDGGNPGSTGNSDAKVLADIFAKYAEAMRKELNGLGASIGKLDGWAGAQVHDTIKMLKVSPEQWAARTIRYLDVERTFPDAPTQREALDILTGIYRTIITGMPETPTPAERGVRVNPANMAKSLGKSRVLHFKDPDAAIGYRDEFGYGMVADGMMAHLGNGARLAANMKVLGPNPKVMFDAMAESLKRRVKNSKTLTPEEIHKLSGQLSTEAGALRHALDIATGVQATPENIKWAQIGQDIRNFESMAKLGGALFSSVGDPLTAALAGQFRGNGFFRSLAQQFGNFIDGSAEGRELMFLLGEGFDGITHNITAAQAGADGRLGMTGRLTELYYRANGLTWWTDRQRMAAARVVSAEMGMRSATAHGDLPAAYRHVLDLHGIGEKEWEAIRQSSLRQVNGRDYVTPDRIEELPDDAITPLVQDRLDRARAASRVDEPTKDPEVRANREADYQDRASRIIAQGRDDLAMQVRRFFADEVTQGIIEVDPRARRTTTLGFRPGSLAGEAMRFVMQFKGWPVAFTQRVLGRQFFARRAGSWDPRQGTFWRESAPQIGTLLASLTLAGYATIMIKDAMKGYWPPRDPSDLRTWMAALQQGGAWGIYGDFLFSTRNRYGADLASTLAGPTLGTFSDLWNIASDARDFAVSGGEDPVSAANAFSTIWANTPGANLFYVKPAMDILWVNALRELLSPGYLRRQATNRERDYGQTRFSPQTLGDFAR